MKRLDHLKQRIHPGDPEDIIHNGPILQRMNAGIGNMNVFE